MKKYLRLKLALIIVWLTRPLYFWSIENIISIKHEDNPTHEPQLPAADVEYCKEVVMSYFNNIWRECFKHRLTRIHRGKLRFDAWIITPTREWNTKEPIPDTMDAYVIKFERHISDSQEIEIKTPRH